jgi:hypothetical protein
VGLTVKKLALEHVFLPGFLVFSSHHRARVLDAHFLSVTDAIKSQQLKASSNVLVCVKGLVLL